MKKVFVAGLQQEVDVMRLIELFSIHGSVEHIHIVMDPKTGKNKGYAFLDMTSELGAKRVIEALQGFIFDGKKLDIKLATENKKPVVAKKNFTPRTVIDGNKSRQ